jgi:hypothetical protein
MRSALYFPHTTIDNVNLVKTALLLWDKLEYIVPRQDFGSVHGNRHVQRAMEIIGKERVPSKSEKREAHGLVEKMAESALPPAFYMSHSVPRAGLRDVSREIPTTNVGPAQAEGLVRGVA